LAVLKINFLKNIKRIRVRGPSWFIKQLFKAFASKHSKTTSKAFNKQQQLLMLSLATTTFNFNTEVLASCSFASTKLAAYSIDLIDQLSSRNVPLLVCSLLLSLACYFAFNSLNGTKTKVYKIKVPSKYNLELKGCAQEIELSSIDPVMQLKPESAPLEPNVTDPSISTSTHSIEKKAENSTALIIYQPSKVYQRSRRNSIKSRCKGPGEIGYVNLTFSFTGPDNKTIVPLDHERIKLVVDEEEITAVVKSNSQEAPDLKKPFEYYLRWDLKTIELEKLSFSEKSRRFYLFSKYGEIKNQESKPPDQVQVLGEVYELPPEPAAKPANLITNLMQQADFIDIPEFQIQLLKLNHQLVQSNLNRIEKRKFSLSSANILRGLFDFSAKNNLKLPAIDLDVVASKVKVASEQWSKKKYPDPIEIKTKSYNPIDFTRFNPKLILLK
jgi:hypothetical protein